MTLFNFAGVGRIGKVHLRSVIGNPRLQPRWLVDLDLEYLESVLTEFHLSRDQCSVTTFQYIEPAVSDQRSVFNSC